MWIHVATWGYMWIHVDIWGYMGSLYIYMGIHEDTCGYMGIGLHVDTWGYMWIYVDIWVYIYIYIGLPAHSPLYPSPTQYGYRHRLLWLQTDIASYMVTDIRQSGHPLWVLGRLSFYSICCQPHSRQTANVSLYRSPWQ